jgi:hypothetical protein
MAVQWLRKRTAAEIPVEEFQRECSEIPSHQCSATHAGTVQDTR